MPPAVMTTELPDSLRDDVVDLAREDWANSLTHGIGFLLSLWGAAALWSAAQPTNDAARIAGCAVYAATLTMVYAASTLSHLFQRPLVRRFFRTVDQACIYLLIVGTYTPIAAAYLHGGFLTILFWAMWIVALVGFLSKTVWRHRVDAISTIGYLVLGWMPILAVPAAISLVPPQALWLMVGGGVCYTIGVIFLVCDHRVPYFHVVWHLFVMAAGGIHYFAIYRYVAVGAGI